MVKIYSWNVNGIRAVLKKDMFLPFIKKHDPDILCLQETKAKDHQVELDLPGYRQFWYSAERPGYSGTAIFSKTAPLTVTDGLPEDIIKTYKVAGDTYGDANKEGRVMAAEFDDFYVVTAYTPNAKDDLTRIPLRQTWDAAITAYCKALEEGRVNLRGTSVNHGVGEVQGAGEQRTEPYQEYGEGAAQQATPQFAKPVIYCGDMNVAHTEDDLANPKPNVGKKGFTAEERAGFDNWLAAGFVDTFRIFTQGNGHYTWWSHFANARARNVGWRIDYFLVSDTLKSKVKAAAIHADVMGSDHCPISVTLDV